MMNADRRVAKAWIDIKVTLTALLAKMCAGTRSLISASPRALVSGPRTTVGLLALNVTLGMILFAPIEAQRRALPYVPCNPCYEGFHRGRLLHASSAFEGILHEVDPGTNIDHGYLPGPCSVYHKFCCLPD